MSKKKNQHFMCQPKTIAELKEHLDQECKPMLMGEAMLELIDRVIQLEQIVAEELGE